MYKSFLFNIKDKTSNLTININNCENMVSTKAVEKL